MVRLLALVTLVLSLVLFPPAVLAYLSQDAVPGEKMYPIKRGLEDVILTVASLNPWSKAFVATARSARRFREAEALLARGSSEATKTLNELVTQTSSAAEDIQKVGNIEQKKALIAKLSKEIESFDKGLSEVQAKTVTATSPSPNPAPPSPTPTSQPTPSPSPSPEPKAVAKASPSSAPSPVAASPVPSPSPSPSPLPTSSPAHPVATSQAKEIEETRKALEEIKKKLKEESRKHKEGEKEEKSDKEKDQEPHGQNTGLNKGKRDR